MNNRTKVFLIFSLIQTLCFLQNRLYSLYYVLKRRALCTETQCNSAYLGNQVNVHLHSQ